LPKPNAKRKPRRKTAKKKRKSKPSTTEANGKDKKSGKFLPGNKCAKGNPFAKQVAQLRAAFYEALTEEDLKEVAMALIKKAKKGDVAAIKELLLRVMGQPQIPPPPPTEEGEWLHRINLPDGSHLIVPAGTDPIDAYHESIRGKEPKDG
jgi:hypothetical protein